MHRRSFLSVSAAAAASGSTPRAFPPFRWDTVPVFNHLGKREGHFTDAEARTLARFPIVTIEKGQAGGAGATCEQGAFDAARKIRSHNSSAKVLFYLNLVIDWPGYAARKTFERHPEWRLLDATGKPVTLFDRYIFDVSQPAVREWWSDTVADAVERGPMDGVFADAIPKIAMLEAQNRKRWGDQKYEAVERGLRELLTQTKRKMGPGKILLFNGLRGTKNWADGGARYLEYADAAMIEHFAGVSSVDASGRLKAEMVVADWELMRLASRKGKMVHVKAWPAFTKGFPDRSKFPPTQAERVRVAREQIEFPLAAFLIGAEANCYFGYSWSYGVADGWLEWYPEYDRRLGPPRTRARGNGWRFTREFERARVEVDLGKEWCRIEWS